MRRCYECGVLKPASDYSRDGRRSDGLNIRCKDCHNARTRAYIKRKYGSTRHYHLKQRFGIGADDFDRMKAAQGGLCAGCGVAEATQVDHDHATDKVRGLLCLKCNAALGALHDDLRLVYMAIDYLETARGNTIDKLADGA